jgi:hypothetical protein
MIAYASHHNLQAMFNCMLESGVVSRIGTFLEVPADDYYVNMNDSINAWLQSNKPLTCIGLSAQDSIPGMQVIVGDPTGSCVYDSLAGTNNKYTNIDVTDSTTGKLKIGKNVNTQPNVMQALMSQSGQSFHARYSNVANAKQLILTVRMGNNPSEPVGTVMIAMTAPDS